MALDLENDILDKVYDSHILGDENKDNLNPKREVKLTQDESLSKVLGSSEFSNALSQAEDYFKNVVAREPEDFDEVIQKVLEDAVISAGDGDPSKKLIDAKKLGLDSLDEPILALAGISPSIATSAADALLAEIAEQIVKLTIYKNKDRIGEPPTPPDPNPPEPKTPTIPDYVPIPLSPAGPTIQLPPENIIFIEIYDPDGPTLDLPEGWEYIGPNWIFGPGPGPVPGPLPPGIKILVYTGVGPDGSGLDGPIEYEIPDWTSKTGEGEGSGSGSGSTSGSDGGSSDGGSSGGSSSSGSGEGPEPEPGIPEPEPGPEPEPTPPGPTPEPTPPEGPTIEEFLEINCDGTISLIVADMLSKDNSEKAGEYKVNKINNYNTSANGGTDDGSDSGDDENIDGRNAFDQLMMDENGNCIEYELTILKILLVLVKIIKIIAAMIDPVGMLACEIARVVCLVSSAWHNPPTIAEVIAFIMGKIEAILVKVIGWILNMLYGLAPSMFCAIGDTADIIQQLRDAILAIGTVGTEINNLASSFADVNKTTHKAIKDMTSEILDTCTEMMNGLNPDRLTDGGKSFKELWATTKNEAKNAGLDFTSGSAAAKTAHNLLKDGAGEGNKQVQEAYNDAVEAVKAIQDMRNAVQQMTGAYKHTFSQAGAFAQIGTLFSKKTEGSWQDWADVTESWSDFTTATKNAGEAYAAGATPLATAFKTNSMDVSNVKEEFDDPREVQNPDGSTTTEHKKVCQMEDYQAAKKELKSSESYKKASRSEQIDMMYKFSQEYYDKYGASE